MMTNKASLVLALLSVLAGIPAYAGTHPQTGIVVHDRIGGASFDNHRHYTFPSARSSATIRPSFDLDTLLLLPGAADSSTVQVLVPDEGIHKGSRYPVLYILENRDPGVWKRNFDSLMMSGNRKSIWVIFTLPESDNALLDRSLWLASLKSFIEQRYPVPSQTASHHLAGMGEEGGRAFRLLLQEPGSFGNGIFFLRNSLFPGDDLSLLQTQASRLSGKYCFVLSQNDQSTACETWLDSLALLSHGIIYAYCLRSGKGSEEGHFPLAYAWLMADGPNKLVNSGD